MREIAKKCKNLQENRDFLRGASKGFNSLQMTFKGGFLGF
jgi:hypothetical protein